MDWTRRFPSASAAREAQLIKADPRSSTYLACALLVRGDVTISDVNRNVAKLRSTLRMPSWGSEGFKARTSSRALVSASSIIRCAAARPHRQALEA